MSATSPGFELFASLLVFVVLPVGTAVFFGSFAFRHMEKLVFSCLRCGEMFRQKAHRPFPRECPRCHARNWNQP
jgi:Zn finger protein HypA/HybF involved in hydrogenase expression